MDYSKIKKLMDVNKITRQEIAYRANVTPYGFDKMITNKSMKIEVLEKISKALNVPMSYWFEGDSGNEASELDKRKIDYKTPGSQANGKIMDSLTEQLKVKDEQIRSLIDKIPNSENK